jgi:hypothetical protein
MNVHLFQFHPNAMGEGQALPGFEALDSAPDSRPEWGEYWAILDYLKHHPVDENDLYGFLLPDFTAQTGLSAADVRQAIKDNEGHGAYVFSPLANESACYLNVFEQGNRLHPGFIEIAESFFEEIGLEIDLRVLATPASAMARSAWLVARPEFWRIWSALAEKLIELSGDEQSAFYRKMAATPSPVNVQHARVLLIERLASLVLALCPGLSIYAHEARAMPGAKAAYLPFQTQIDLLGKIKDQANDANDAACLENFYALRGSILSVTEGARLNRAKNGFLRTPFNASPDLLYVCFTHVPLIFEYPSFVQTLCLGEAQGPGKTNLRDIAPEWEQFHPILGSLAGVFAVKNYIVENRLPIKQVGICQYRKFVSAMPISDVRVANYTAMQSIGRESLKQIDLAQAMLPGEREFVLPEIAKVDGGYLNQYKDAHVVEDFLRFTSEATELGVLPREEVSTFFNTWTFIPGGIEAGVYPTQFWVNAVTAIEGVVRACLQRYPYRRVGYQARAWAFCAERLGSYLLLKYLNTRYSSQELLNPMVGRLNLVTVDEQAVYVAGR